MGGYAMIKKQFFDERLKLKAATRFDRSKNFEPLFSPVVSGVYTLNRRHNFRLNFTSALRNPTLADQYLYYNVGQARLIGNLNGVDSVVGLNTYYDLINNALTGIQDTLQQLAYNIDPIRPEQVRTIELGYKGNPVRPLFIDATYYFSWYDHFIGYNLVTPVPEDNSTAIEPLRVAANADTRVTTQGFTIGANFFFAEFYSLSGNYTWTVLNEQDADSPIIPAYNTPEHKFNVSLSGRKLSYDLGLLPLRNVGFNFNLKWVEGFLFEGSPQFTGRIDTYWTLDGQVNYTYEPWNTTLKVGASNMLDRHYIQAYGGPTIGRMAYFSVTVNVD
jgi:outer membrane cobalamin receptor